eukprot:TRINITY_DN29052_c0_g1_i1.p2 TRINITY_DN29052_c0_g1~~TRINITY_DN29052_c0_g1_i1.p2  ORF type:complete len:928 (+),score=137.89 TRINITY_DN29052_c0_g1_i1:74-2785(+)
MANVIALLDQAREVYSSELSALHAEVLYLRGRLEASERLIANLNSEPTTLDLEKKKEHAASSKQTHLQAKERVRISDLPERSPTSQPTRLSDSNQSARTMDDLKAAKAAKVKGKEEFEARKSRKSRKSMAEAHRHPALRMSTKYRKTLTTLEVVEEEEDEPEKDPLMAGNFNLLFQFVTSHIFEVGSSAVIAIYALVMAFEIQYDGIGLGNDIKYPWVVYTKEEAWPSADVAFSIIGWIFGIIFTIEIILKMVGLRKFFLPDVWNWVDLTIVVFWLASKLGDLAPNLPVNAQLLRLARLVRLLRLLKLAKTIQSFDSLYLMTTALAGSLQVLSWACALLILVQAGASLLLNQLLFDLYFNQPDVSDKDKLEVYEYFGTFTRSMLSMFEITLANWPPICRILSENVTEWFMPICIVHKLMIGFAVVGVISLLKGIFLQKLNKGLFFFTGEAGSELEWQQGAASGFWVRNVLKYGHSVGDSLQCLKEWKGHFDLGASQGVSKQRVSRKRSTPKVKWFFPWVLLVQWWSLANAKSSEALLGGVAWWATLGHVGHALIICACLLCCAATWCQRVKDVEKKCSTSFRRKFAVKRKGWKRRLAVRCLVERTPMVHILRLRCREKEEWALAWEADVSWMVGDEHASDARGTGPEHPKGKKTQGTQLQEKIQNLIIEHLHEELNSAVVTPSVGHTARFPHKQKKFCSKGQRPKHGHKFPSTFKGTKPNSFDKASRAVCSFSHHLQLFDDSTTDGDESSEGDAWHDCLSDFTDVFVSGAHSDDEHYDQAQRGCQVSWLQGSPSTPLESRSSPLGRTAPCDGEHDEQPGMGCQVSWLQGSPSTPLESRSSPLGRTAPCDGEHDEQPGMGCQVSWLQGSPSVPLESRSSPLGRTAPCVGKHDEQVGKGCQVSWL